MYADSGSRDEIKPRMDTNGREFEFDPVGGLRHSSAFICSLPAIALATAGQSAVEGLWLTFAL